MGSNNEDVWQSPAVKPLSSDNVRVLADTLHLACSEEEISAYTGHLSKLLKSYQRLNTLVEPSLQVKYQRTPGYRPSEEENQLHAWYYRCEITGAAKGKLAGKRVGIKDNTAVAGVPMMNGSKILEGYVPEYDATVVTRILDAGGIILGKSSCDDMCFCPCGFNNSTGPVINPTCPGYMTGGSSSGSAALVASGTVDMATGGDQAGSIRIPASWCGIVGLKPTFGLVPYTGCVSLDMSLDHCGPMTNNVRDCALMLEVLAGYDDGLDPRQPKNLAVPAYSELLGDDLKDKRIALLKEGFENCEPDVVDMVKMAAKSLEQKGAVVEEVSLPAHKDGGPIFMGITVEGSCNNVVKDNGHTPGWKGQYLTSLLDKLAQGKSARPHDFPEAMKPFMILAKYLTDSYNGRFYAKAQNLARYLTREYDKLLEDYDVMVMPTVAHKAPKVLTADSTVKERLEVFQDVFQNTAPFNVTGHPSLSINVGRSDGLPVGMMITGKHFDDVTVLQIAHVFETLRDL